MEKDKIVKCKYANCLHETKELNKEEAIKSGNSYYHPDCFRTKEDIKQVIDLFKKHINPNPVYAQLHSVIKNIVFTKNVSSELLLFGLKYYIDHKIPLNYPQGLYYVIQRKEVIDAYNKAKVKEMLKEKSETVEIAASVETEFTHVATKTRGFADILR